MGTQYDNFYCPADSDNYGDELANLMGAFEREEICEAEFVEILKKNGYSPSQIEANLKEVEFNRTAYPLELELKARARGVNQSMKNFDTFLNACESIKYLDSVVKEGDTYTLIGCGKTLQIKERVDSKGNREVLLWSKTEPSNLHKVVGNDVEKILPRLVVQHFTGIKSSVEFTDHENHKHIFEDVGFFPVSVHSDMVRFGDATGRKWVCSAGGSNVPNITLAFYKLLYDGRTDMSAMMLPKLTPLDDVKVIKSGKGGKDVEVFELPKFPEPSEDFIVSSVEDFKRAVPNYESFMMFPHQGDVPAYGHSIVSGMVVSSADRPFITSAEKKMRGFIKSSDELDWKAYQTFSDIVDGLMAQGYSEADALKLANELRGKDSASSSAKRPIKSVTEGKGSFLNHMAKQSGKSITDKQGNPLDPDKMYQDNGSGYEEMGQSLQSGKRPIKSGLTFEGVDPKVCDGYLNYLLGGGVPVDKAMELTQDFVNRIIEDCDRFAVSEYVNRGIDEYNKSLPQSRKQPQTFTQPTM